jgi:hypothetical protein
MRRFFQVFWAIVAAIIVVPVAGGWFSELAKEKGLYEHPSENMEAVMTWLSSFVSQPTYWGLAGLVVGMAVGMWMDAILKRREKDGVTARPGYIRTALTLHFSGGYEQPTSLIEENVLDWYVYWTVPTEVIDQNRNILFHGPSSWILFLNFKQATDYHSVSVDFIGGKPPSYQIRRTLITSIVVSIDGPMPPCSLELRTRAKPSPFG